MPTYIDTKPINNFRQGIYSVNNLFERNSLSPKILPSQNSAVIETNIFGQAKSYTDDTTFIEQAKFDPVTYINDTSFSITYPAVLADVNARDLNQLDGTIEPLAIRPVIALNSINYPYEPNRAWGSLSDGNEDLDFRNSRIVSKYFLGEETSIPYIDLSTDDLIGKPDIFSDIVAKVSPFNDVLSLTEINGVSISGDDMTAAILAMDPKEDSYIDNLERVATSGYQYEGNLLGTDSIAFGGLGN